MSARSIRMPLAVLLLDILAAAGTWLGWSAAGHDGARAAVSVLLLATPIGMVLATTTPSWLTRRVGRRLGVTTIGSRALERWHQVHTMVLDPFRSLTTGHLVVTGVHAIDPDHERNLRWFAGALAHSYDDPVGRAVSKLAGRGRISNVAQEPGLGIRGSVDRHPVRVGQPGWLGISEDGTPGRIGTTVAVDVDQRPLGRITVADEVRPDAARQLDRLRRTGVTPVLVSDRHVDETQRLAELSATPAWHAETDPLRFARELALGGEPVGLLHSEPDGTASMLVVDSTHGSTDPSPDDSLGLTTPSIEDVVHAVLLAVRGHRAQRRSVRLAWLLLLLPLPFAALGLVPPLVALPVAALTWVVIGVAGSWELFGIRTRAKPDEASGSSAQ